MQREMNEFADPGEVTPLSKSNNQNASETQRVKSISVSVSNSNAGTPKSTEINTSKDNVNK